jgi:integrase/recombinase XerD
MKISAALSGFTLYLVENRRSHHTVKTYSVYLGLLAEYLCDPEVTDVTQQNLKDFLGWLGAGYVPRRPSGDTSPLMGASLDKARIACKSFYHWASDEFDIPNPSMKLARPEYESAPVVPFTDPDLHKLLRACARTRYPKRNTAIVLTLLDTGCRAGELSRIKVCDVDLETGAITVAPFGSSRKSRPRIVYVGTSTRRALWRYIANSNLQPPAPLFGMTPNGLKLLCARLGKLSRVSDVHPHRFRHTFALNFLKNGGNSIVLQRLLGHATMDMTARYVLLASADLAAAHQLASPVDRLGLR